MRNSATLRFSLGILLVLSLLSPTAVLARGDGKKHFKEGMKHEEAEVWDKAAESFALAVADNPKNPEYRLHLQRALFNASQMYMRRGTAAAKEKDYEGGYNAFRKAYAFDPTNELAKAEMDRMVRLQTGSQEDRPENKKASSTDVKLVPTAYSSAARPQDFPLPQKLENLRNLPFPGGIDLQTIVKELARSLDLNVLFDTESRLDSRKVKIELQNVTAAKALDYIFLQENLFFQKVGPRTILVASGNRRTNFQQLVLRTFYLANANPKDVMEVIRAAIPPQPGRAQTTVLKDDATNSITVRDTEENIRLIGKLISSLDKDRAEVVMDVAIYEVSKSDLLRLGNQLGTESQLTNFGGTTRGVVTGRTDHGRNLFKDAAGALIPQSLGVGLILPAANLIAFQSKDNTKLLASTQIHAFNNEDSSARIGQRVPVKTATFQTGNNIGSGGIVSDVINYEQVGLTLKFKPLVFPNQDVQVAMEIESKDVAGATTLQPIFTERTIKGTARVQNNKTLLLASVAQGTESKGREGLPLLGLIPIIGRLFTAPTRDNRQVDIVIAVTPRVIRAPSILPEDEVERPTGSIAVPTSGSLEAMIIEEEREELLAAARRLPTTAQVQLPDQKADTPTYVRTANSTQPVAGPAVENQPVATVPKPDTPALDIKPIDSSVKTLQITPTAFTNPLTSASPASQLVSGQDAVRVTAPTAELEMAAALPEMKKGERTKVAITVNNSAPFQSAVLGLKFDSSKLAIRSVQVGDVFGAGLTNSPVSPFLNQNGKMYVSLSLPGGSVQGGSGILAFVEVEALADVRPELAFDRDAMNFLTADGKNFTVKY